MDEKKGWKYHLEFDLEDGRHVDVDYNPPDWMKPVTYKLTVDGRDLGTHPHSSVRGWNDETLRRDIKSKLLTIPG